MSIAPTTTDRLTSIETARRAVLDNGQPVPRATLPLWLERSWRRCLDLGHHPAQRVSFDEISTARMRLVSDVSAPLVRAARPVLEHLAHAMAQTRYFAILTDAQGVVVDVNGPVDRQDPRAQAIARIGVDLSESAIGTTAIGLALIEQQAVWLHRGEHFFEDNTGYSCAGAPIFGPHGHCVGMLDLTGIDVVERPALKHLVAQAARSIENTLVLRQPHQLQVRLAWPGQTLGGEADGLLCLDGDGYVSAANRAACDMLSLEGGIDGVHATDLLAVANDALFALGAAPHSSHELPLWSGLRLVARISRSPGGGWSEAPPTDAPRASGAPLREIETALIRKAVDDARGNVMEAARKLGISRATVYRKLGNKRRDG